jgi:hypothetical protein
LTDGGQALLGPYVPIFPYPERAGVYDTATSSFTYLPVPASYDTAGALIGTRGLELNSRGQVLGHTTEALRGCAVLGRHSRRAGRSRRLRRFEPVVNP